MHRFTMLICMTRRLISKPIAYFKFKCGKRIVQFFLCQVYFISYIMLILVKTSRGLSSLKIFISLISLWIHNFIHVYHCKLVHIKHFKFVSTPPFISSHWPVYKNCIHFTVVPYTCIIIHLIKMNEMKCAYMQWFLC